MVSQPRRPNARSSRDRLVAAATAEFSARGFDGAKVDRIAARARVNKAMLYYHFRNKAALYRHILHDTFEALARALDTDDTRTGTPEARIRAFVRIIAAETETRPLFPSIWLREMGEGGRHIDAETLRPIGAVLETLTGILRDGCAGGTFRPLHPVVVQLAIVAPLLLFAASAPLRDRYSNVMPGGIGFIPRADMVHHLEVATLAALTARESAAPPVQSRSTRR